MEGLGAAGEGEGVVAIGETDRGQHGVDGGEFRGANRGEARNQMGV
jgi:hypothetical protein